MKFIMRKTLTPLEEKIIETAVGEFEQKGYFQASVDVIAEKAGIGKGTVYRHFGKKISLFLSVVTRTMFEMERDFQQAGKDLGFRESIELYLDSAEHFSVRRGRFFRAVMAEDRFLHIKNEIERNMDINIIYTHLMEHRDRMIGILKDALDIGKREKAIFPDIDTAIAADLIFMTINQFFKAFCDLMDIKHTIGITPKFTKEQGFAEMKKMILRGLGIDKPKGDVR
ncbi:MAG: hypothetical protein A2Y33_00865 [Spirochaetes bacterium GWF1_51_8]|nr:MAG: hypothetical protein A2Y33_00865 [Spirochaetes bacterium GWF1_51_8]